MSKTTWFLPRRTAGDPTRWTSADMPSDRFGCKLGISKRADQETGE